MVETVVPGHRVVEQAAWARHLPLEVKLVELLIQRAVDVGGGGLVGDLELRVELRHEFRVQPTSWFLDPAPP